MQTGLLHIIVCWWSTRATGLVDDEMQRTKRALGSRSSRCGRTSAGAAKVGLQMRNAVWPPRQLVVDIALSVQSVFLPRGRCSPALPSRKLGGIRLQ